jgi:general L-amino acid transport system permease protein
MTSITSRTREVLPPPTERYTILGWLKKNLFQNWLSTLVTLSTLALIVWAGSGMIRWAFTQAQWAVVWVNLRLFAVGQYPITDLWRVWIPIGMLGFIIGASWALWMQARRTETLLMAAAPFALALLPFTSGVRLAWVAVGGLFLAGLALGRLIPNIIRKPILGLWLLYLPLAFMFVRGLNLPNSPLALVSTNLWGGLLLTFLLAGIGMVLSFPIGTLLAIGRQSKYPVIRAFCIVFIELVRAVPLISVLFMAQTMLPLFLPESVTPDRVVRALTAITIFSSAYMAENVRGGLQAIEKGQYEAAKALGLNDYLSMRLIILPQALKKIIPILTVHVIGGFRDTSLVIVVGLLDLLGIARSVLAQSQFLGRHIEVYAFLAAVYWLFSYIMSTLGQRIEARVGIQRS